MGAGATIRVGPGTFEGADVDVPGVRIMGVDGASTITGGLKVVADDVVISGLAITGRETAYQGGVTVDRARGVVISGNRMAGNSFGIYLIDARDALVERNHVTDNAYGIEVHGDADGIVIRGNDIVENDRPLDDARAAGGLNLYLTSGAMVIADQPVQWQ
ncbi:MAG: right-handed parallel beta-helix repeat-containing protein [Candidatus Limnocylindrales bacterium]